MGRLAADAGVLGAMLDALCGWERPADGDRVVREALAEALLMLVGPGISSMWFLAPGFRPACDADVAECCGVLECVPHGRSAHLAWTSLAFGRHAPECARGCMYLRGRAAHAGRAPRGPGALRAHAGRG